MAGPPGTLVVMNFKDHSTDQVRAVNVVTFECQRSKQKNATMPSLESSLDHICLHPMCSRQAQPYDQMSSVQHYDVIALRHLPQSTRTPVLQMPEMSRPLSVTSYPEVPPLGRIKFLLK